LRILGELGGVLLGDGLPVRIVGVLNLGEESFYKASIARSIEDSVRKVTQFVEEGADIIDVGGASTAPGVPEIPFKVEYERVRDFLKHIVDASSVPVSIDTQNAEVAEYALSAGASIVNDVSGLRKDPRIADVVAEFGASLVVMACREKPGDALSVQQAVDALRRSISMAIEKGVKPSRIVVDPGIGFGKPFDADFALLKELRSLRVLGKPIMISVSRKRFIGYALGGVPPEERLYGSLAATAVAVYEGVHAIRTHDVKATSDAVKVAEKLR